MKKVKSDMARINSFALIGWVVTLGIISAAYLLEVIKGERSIVYYAILLICAILDDAKLKAFYQLSQELGLDVLVECHDEVEIERALEIEAPVIGINNRNLNDFSIISYCSCTYAGILSNMEL